MATLSTLPCISRPSLNFTTTTNTTTSSSLSIAPRNVVTACTLSHQSTRLCIPNSRWNCKASRLQRLSKLRSSVAQEQETLIPQEEEEEEGLQQQQPVSVSVSPSDILTMFFQAEGTLNEAAIPTVAKALEETEGISNLKVQVLEGIATVELTKQTTVQATGVASSLVEIIQGSGFKLQTLNLSFEDEEDIE